MKNFVHDHQSVALPTSIPEEMSKRAKMRHLMITIHEVLLAITI